MREGLAADSFWLLVVLVTLVCGIALAVEALAQSGGTKVSSIDIRGNKKIELQAIAGRLTLKVGDPYTPENVRGQIKILYDTGYFEDVQVETESMPDGTGLTFLVREKPFITEIVFDGNDELSDDKLKEKITIKNQAFLDQQQAKESAEKIRLAYQEDGYFDCQVIPVVQTLDEDRKRLTFFVKEGEKAKVKTVNFEGLRAATKDDMFKVMATREWVPWYGLVTQLKLPSFLSDAGVLKREEMNNDVERIKEILLNRGFLNAQVGLPAVDLSEDKKWFTVTYPIIEGEPFTVAEVGFRGNTVFEEPELREKLKIKEGEIFQRQKIRDEITRLTDLYGSKGYAFADVVPNVTPNPEERTAVITLNIREGEMMRIRQINVNGNEKTKDNVIRRELRVDEQDVIDTPSLKRSFQRLNNLNFFETVEILPQQVDADKVDLNVRVKEKATGQFSIGGGFSTLDRLVAIADITEGNLGGNGWMGRIRGQLGQQRTLGLITFRNPYLNDSLTSMQIDIFRSMTNYVTYFERKAGASLTFGRWLSEYVTGSFSLVAEQLNFSDPIAGAPELVLQQLGTQTTTGFRTSLARDTRDYFMDPRTGWRSSIGFDLGTPYLGGTNNFVKYYLDVIKYTPLPMDTRFSIHVRYGAAEGLHGKPIPLTERFFVGGINTMRGFVFGRAGPVTESGSLLGAARELIFNNDFIFTISSEAKLNGVIFFDYGKGFDDGEKVSFDLRPAAGLEGRWISPFGPLRAAYGINLDPRPGERKGVFEFTIGSLF
ncbi:putative Outer membrane protein assembly factor YaeT [Nitrospira japonica]|uniref:Outer membrane protein assembly factor BamA n=1 Tax=Nitrospira japonica TaxID=1325564 RepID=A0A1W1HZN5_9BACT|nr:outer membrane protein assembly factor BamA [Nitrospira japonica]SLM46194.1 putative Outer membrane protein assembly factor YaeT [Nitrospira japonica]